MLLTAARAKGVAPGLFMALLVAMAAQFLSDHYGAPVMLMAILLGIPFQFLSNDPRMSEGINFAAKSVLRIGVALLGLRVSVELLWQIGPTFAVLIALGVLLTIAIGILTASVFGKDYAFGFLAGGSVAICGASAALALASLLPKHDKSETNLTFTVVSVTVASTVAMIVYPIAASVVGFDDRLAGIFLGGTIHDVAQVVGAGFSMSDETGEVATLIKLFRVTMLAPVVFVGALVLRKNAPAETAPPIVPMFVLVFIALAGLNSLHVFPIALIEYSNQLSRACLITAVAAVGMKTSLQDLQKVGGGAVGLVASLTAFLAIFVMLGVLAFG